MSIYEKIRYEMFTTRGIYNITLKDFAVKAGIAYTTARDFENGQTKPTATVLYKIRSCIKEIKNGSFN